MRPKVRSRRGSVESPRFCSILQAAQSLEISYAAACRLVEKGDLRFWQKGRQHLVQAGDLRRYMKRHGIVARVIAPVDSKRPRGETDDAA